MRQIRILFTGGGSGGHTYPLLAVAEALRKIAAQNAFSLDLYYLGPKDQWSSTLDGYGVHARSILGAKFRRYFSLMNIVDIPKFFIAVVQALWKMFWIMPDAVFSKGGVGAFSVVIAAWFYRIPIMIHESDTKPGLNNILSARCANRIAVSFESAMIYFNPRKVLWTGNPIRESLLTSLPPSQASAKTFFHFDDSRPLILVLGGSQGSKTINEFIVTILPELIKETQVLHQTALAHFDEVQKLARAALLEIPLSDELKSRYQPVAELNDEMMKHALAAADIVVSRSGSSIFEIAAFGKPAILIPHDAGNGHQRVNAYEFAKSGGAVVIEESNLLPGIFLGQVHDILKQPSRLQAMCAASQKFFKRGAAEEIAKEVMKLALRTGSW